MFWLYEEWRGQSSVCAGDTDPLLLPVLASIRQNEPENEEFVLYGDDKAIAGAGAGCGDITILPGLGPRLRPCRDPSQVGDMRPHSSSDPD